MKDKIFEFKIKVHSGYKVFSFKAPVNNGYVITNKYCPQELITVNIPDVANVNAVKYEDFINDCRDQLSVISSYDKEINNKIDAHIGGIMVEVTNHIKKCHRIIWGDLLIYMDCFSYLLKSDGFTDEYIYNAYPQILYRITELYYPFVKNTYDLSNYRGGRIEKILLNLINKLCG